MATNPMKRQARNSFLLGMVCTLIITAIIVALLFMQIKKLNEQIQEDKAATKNVYVLNQDVSAGQELTADLFTMKTVKSDGIPENATSDISLMLQTYSLCDKQGNNIYTDEEGKLYMQTDNTKTVITKDENTGKYYTQGANGTKNEIELSEKPLLAKVDMKARTVITTSFIARSDEMSTDDDIRQQEYNMLVLPTDLFTGDYIDVRLQFPSGQDYIVMSKKKVTIPKINGAYSSDIIQMNLTEGEILTMANAIVEAYKVEGSKLYVTKYTEPGIQKAATPTYVVSGEVAKLMDADPNIVQKAKVELANRYRSASSVELRNQHINSALSNNGKDENIPSKVEESITSTRESRQQYLQSLPETSTTSGTTSSSTTTSGTSN